MGHWWAIGVPPASLVLLAHAGMLLALSQRCLSRLGGCLSGVSTHLAGLTSVVVASFAGGLSMCLCRFKVSWLYTNRRVQYVRRPCFRLELSCIRCSARMLSPLALSRDWKIAPFRFSLGGCDVYMYGGLRYGRLGPCSCILRSGVGLAALGTASSFAAGHLGAFTPYVRRFNWTITVFS